MSIDKKYSITEYMLMFLFLAVSGGEFFCMTYGRYFIPLFLLCSFWLHFKRFHRVRIFNSSLYIFIGLTYMTIHYLFVYPNHVKNTFLPSVLMLIGAYLYLTCYSLDRFKKLYLNTVYVMAIISMVLLGLALLGLIKPSLHSSEDSAAYLFLGHNLGRGFISSRLSGIYWEPGAYQIVLNITFLLYINEFVNRKINRADIKKFAVILLALLLTVSTAGYLFLALIVAYWAFLRVKVNFNIFRLLAVSLIGVVALIGIYQSEAIQGKMLEREQEYDSSSYTIRANDNLALLLMISERPIMGWGRDSYEFIHVGENLGSITFSNGVTSMIACLGFPFFFIYLFFLFRGMKSVYPHRNVLYLVFLFLFLNCFEDFWWLPAGLIFFFLNSEKSTVSSRKVLKVSN